MEFVALASGSKGNCTYIGTKNTKILIDVGMSGKAIINNMDKSGINPEEITAIFITHEHSDHIKGAGIFSRKFDVPIYATEKTWVEIAPKIGKIAQSNKQIVYRNESCLINELSITPFSIPHDAVDPMGYCVMREDDKITIVTDLGHIPNKIIPYLLNCDIILMEANHDEYMLENGSYPYDLKRRILSRVGHLSNIATGEFLSKVVTKRLRYIFLGHLSDDNNTPDLAYDTIERILLENGISIGEDLELIVAKQETCTKKVMIR